MAVTYVKALGTVGTAASGSSVTLTLAAGVSSKATNSVLVVAAQATATSTPVSCVDSKGNTYTLLDSLNGRDPMVSVWLAANIVTALVPGDTITVTHSSAASGIQMIAHEFSGPLQVPSDGAAKNNATLADTVFDSTAGTVPGGDHLLIGVVGRQAATNFT